MRAPNLFLTAPVLLIITLAAAVCPSNRAETAERTTLSLDGQWQIADGKLPDAIPGNFTHKVPVPGLAHLANPSFPNVDRFTSRERMTLLVAHGKADPYWMVKYWDGKPEQDRD
jgi:hypothetical protein